MIIEIPWIGKVNMRTVLLWFVIVILSVGFVKTLLLQYGNYDNDEILFLRRQVNELTQSSV